MLHEQFMEMKFNKKDVGCQSSPVPVSDKDDDD